MGSAYIDTPTIAHHAVQEFTVAIPPGATSLRATIAFRRVLLFPLDDPSAVLALRGVIEINPSGTRVVDMLPGDQLPRIC